ncbi:MAG: flagellar export protein FliJ [Opitutaceae bacterium]
MKRFHFNLRPVAVIRAHHKLRARETWAASIRLYDEAIENLGRVRARKTAFEVAVLDSRHVRFDATAAGPALVAYRSVCTEETETVRALNAARDVMAGHRVAYIAAHRRLEAVKRLETKAQLAHREVERRSEQAEFDDFAGLAFHRRLSPL